MPNITHHLDQIKESVGIDIASRQEAAIEALAEKLVRPVVRKGPIARSAKRCMQELLSPYGELNPKHQVDLLHNSITEDWGTIIYCCAMIADLAPRLPMHHFGLFVSNVKSLARLTEAQILRSQELIRQVKPRPKIVIQKQRVLLHVWTMMMAIIDAVEKQTKRPLLISTVVQVPWAIAVVTQVKARGFDSKPLRFPMLHRKSEKSIFDEGAFSDACRMLTFIESGFYGCVLQAMLSVFSPEQLMRFVYADNSLSELEECIDLAQDRLKGELLAQFNSVLAGEAEIHKRQIRRH